MAKHTHTNTQLMQIHAPSSISGPCQYFFHPFIDGQCVTLCERLFAPSENVSVKLNTVYANVVFNKNISLKQADSLLHVDKMTKMRKKRSQNNKKGLKEIK